MTSDPRLNGQDKNDQDVATLIRAAGPRPVLPAERVERVRAAARETWLLESRRTKRRRQLWVGAALAAAALLILAVGLQIFPVSGTGTPPAGFVVESLSGMARALPARGESGAVSLGKRYALSTEVRTAEGARLALRLASGHSIRLDDSTHLRVLPGGSLSLSAGTIYVDSASFAIVAEHTEASAVTVYTPFGRIEEIGTQFEVRLAADAVRVRLREGAVILRGDDDSYPVAVGTEFSLHADGSTETRAVPPHDDAWSWATTIAPPFDLEGRTARAFLDWVARERGLRLVFADAQLARSAGEIILAGKLEGVSVDEALGVVLPTCRMKHRIADGVLTIEADPSFADAPSL